MTRCNCRCRWDCAGFGVVASVIVAIITAFLTYTAAITITPAFLWTLFGIGVVYLAVNLIDSSLETSPSIRSCICSVLPTVLVGIIGTIIIALVLLGVTFAATSVLGAIISGLLLGFFTLTIISTACLILCKTSCGFGDN